MPPAPPPGRVLMVQGTSSHAGKSTLVAALCRILAQDGWRVAPFKAQNMSLNAAVTPDGGEIGRAQMLQAQAARVVPSVHMNPLLLKPQGMRTSQVIVRGRVDDTLEVRDYYARRDRLWPVVTESLDLLRREHDVVVIEGAGSPAEINLRDRDLANMRVARHANAPVLLVGDVERGGVFASLVGTMVLLEPAERALVRGFVINKFRGDVTLLEPGPAMLAERTGVPTLGVLPWFTHVHLPEEDSLGLADAAPAADAVLDVALVRLPHVANFDDVDPLRREPGVRVRLVHEAAALGAPDLVILPGSKTTAADLAWLRASGLADAVVAHRRAGGAVLGLCGGYQMLGRAVRDPLGVEGDAADVPGLGLLPVVTTLAADKVTCQVEGTVVADRGPLAAAAGLAVRGYEIHAGRTETDGAAPALRLTRRGSAAAEAADGALDAEGLVMGTYVHGLLHERPLRRALLEQLAARRGVALPPAGAERTLDDELDALADHVRAHLDVAAVRRIAGLDA